MADKTFVSSVTQPIAGLPLRDFQALYGPAPVEAGRKKKCCKKYKKKKGKQCGKCPLRMAIASSGMERCAVTN